MTLSRYLPVSPGALGILIAVSTASAADKVTFEKDVRPILKQHCDRCHNETQPRGELDVTTIETLLQGGVSGKAVISGKPNLSLLYTMTAHLEEPHMPQNKPKIQQKQLDTLRFWIEGGLLQKDGTKVDPTREAPKTAAQGELGPKPRETATASVTVTPKTSPSEATAELRRATPITALAASPKASLLAVAQQNYIFLYDVTTRQKTGMLTYPEGEVNFLRFSRDGTYLIAGGGMPGASGSVVGYEIPSGKKAFEVGKEIDAVLVADISPDNSLLALGGSSKAVKIFSRDGKLLHTLRKHTDWVLAVSFSPEGLLLASGDRNSGLHVWEAKSGKEFSTLRGHTAAITGLAWHSDSAALASSSDDGTLHIWDMHEGKETASWDAHAEGALSVDWRGKAIVSSGRDKRVCLWDADGKSRGELGSMPDQALRSCFANDGRIIAGDWSGQVRVWAGNGKSEGLVSLPIRQGAPQRSATHLSPELAILKARHAEAAAEAKRLSDAATTAAGEAERLTKALSDARAAVASAEAAAAKAKEAVAALAPVVESRTQAAKSALDRAAQAELAARTLAAEMETFREALQLSPAQVQSRIDQAQAELGKAQAALTEKMTLTRMASETVAKLAASSPGSKTLEQARELERMLKLEEQKCSELAQQRSAELDRARATGEAIRKSSRPTVGSNSP